MAGTLVDVGDGQVVVSCLRAEQPQSVGFDLRSERGGGEVNEEFGAGLDASGDRIGGVDPPAVELAVVPEVFADGDADADGRSAEGDGEYQRVLAGVEVSGFVKDVVGRQQGLGVGSFDLSVTAQRGGVENSLAGRGGIGPDVSHEGGDAVARGGDALDGLHVGFDEFAVEDEVFGRIADDGQFRGDQQIGAGVAGAVQRLRDEPRVAFHVTDDRVELCQRDLHGSSSRRSRIVFHAAGRHCSWRVGECTRREELRRARRRSVSGVPDKRVPGLRRAWRRARHEVRLRPARVVFMEPCTRQGVRARNAVESGRGFDLESKRLGQSARQRRA